MLIIVNALIYQTHKMTKPINILDQPIDFKFKFVDKITSYKKEQDKEVGHYEVSATCRSFDGDCDCNFIVWHIHDIDEKKAISGVMYHNIKELVMREYNDRSHFRINVISQLEKEISKIRKNKYSY